MSVAFFLLVAANIILFGIIWRTLTVKLADTRVGQAMAVIY